MTKIVQIICYNGYVMEEFMNTFVTIEDIINKRTNHRISQTKLAKYSNLSPALLSAWEKGKKTPNEIELYKLNSSLDLMIDEINFNTIDISKKKIVKNKTKVDYKIPKKIETKEEYYELLSKNKIDKKSIYKLILTDLFMRMTNVKDKKSLKGIALFSGCGGLTAGFESAGFDIVGHVEIEHSTNLIYSQNFPKSKLLGNDICDITKEQINLWKKEFGNIDIVIGGPPCQGFSLAGKRNPNDARNQLYNQYANVVGEIKPKVFVMENVFNMTTMKDADGILFIDKIRNKFDELGYVLDINYINAKDYGVPQSRERVIVIGIRKDIDKNFCFPQKNKKVLSFKDATYDLESLESAEISNDPLHWTISHPEHVIKWLKNVPEGHSAHENKDPNLRPSSGFNTTYKRITWDDPCSTISTNFSMISGCRNVHPTSTRSLTIREAARAQSFPDEFVFVENWGDIRKAIGNAVPPLLAEQIAIAIKNQLL